MSIARWITVLLFLPSTAAAAAQAKAAPPTTAASTNPGAADAWSKHAVQLTLGFGSPVGFVGVVYATPALDRAWLHAGVGLGQSGLLLSAMPRLAFYKGQACRLGIGIGGAIAISALASDTQPGPVSAWLDVDLFNVECRSANRSAVSFGLGLSTRVSERIPSDDDGMPDLGNGGPQIHVGFGAAF